jgi:hypothetical protein
MVQNIDWKTVPADVVAVKADVMPKAAHGKEKDCSASLRG